MPMPAVWRPGQCKDRSETSGIAPSLLQDQPPPAPSQQGEHYELTVLPALSRPRRPVDRVTCPFRVMDLYRMSAALCPMRCAGSSINARSVLTCGVTRDDNAKYGCCRPALPLCVPSTAAKHGAERVGLASIATVMNLGPQGMPADPARRD